MANEQNRAPFNKAELDPLERITGMGSAILDRAPGIPWVCPFPSVIAIRWDDGADPSNWWTTASATLAINGVNMSPRSYAIINGVPITAGVIADVVGTANYTTLANLKTDSQMGFEIAAHTYALAVHDTTDGSLTDAQRISDAQACADYIEDNFTYAVAGSSYGRPYGWIQPGGWGGNDDIASALADVDTAWAQWLRKNFEWTHAYCPTGNRNDYGTWARPHFSAQTFSLTSSTTDANIANILARATVPGTKTTALFHTVAGTGLALAQFKTLIDGIVTARDAWKLAPVTMRCLHQCALTPAHLTAGVPDPIFYGGIPFGTMAWGALTIPTSATIGGWGGWYDAYGGTVTLDDANGCADPNWGDTSCISMNWNGTGTAPKWYLNLTVPPGIYAVDFWAKNVGSDFGLASQLRWNDDFGNRVALPTYPDVSAAAWEHMTRLVTVPQGCINAVLELWPTVKAAGDNDGALLLDSFQCMRVG